MDAQEINPHPNPNLRRWIPGLGLRVYSQKEERNRGPKSLPFTALSLVSVGATDGRRSCPGLNVSNPWPIA